MKTIPVKIQRLIDVKCNALLNDITSQLNRIPKQAAEKQPSACFRGEATQGIFVSAYFNFFKSKVHDLFASVITIVEASDSLKEMESAILAYLDSKIRPLLLATEGRVVSISTKKYSEEEPYLSDVYNNLRRNFAAELSLAIHRQKKEQIVEQNIHIKNSHVGQVGNQNVQNMKIDIEFLITKINESNAPSEQKEEARGLLRKLLSHPLVGSVCGVVTDKLLSLL